MRTQDRLRLRNSPRTTAGILFPPPLALLCLVASLVLAPVCSAHASAPPPAGASTTAATPSASDPATTDTASSPVETIAVQSRLVTLSAVVRDKKGALVPTLTRDDFSLLVDGKPQTIRYFDRDANLPLTLGLLVDTSGSVSDQLDQERSASTAFLDDLLSNTKDRAFVMQFARQAELLQDLTNSKPKLEAALRELDTEPPDLSSGNDPNSPNDAGNNTGSNSGNGARHHRGGTTLYDAVFLAGDELMRKQTGRKALIILTDGEDRGSRESLASAIEAVQRADTVVYAIYFKGEQPSADANRGYPGGGGHRGGGIGFPGGGYPGGGGGGWPGGRGNGGGGRPSGGSESHVDGKKILERFAGETGGRVFQVSKKQDFSTIYGQIAEELRTQYRLGFTPDAAAAADGYHQIDLLLPKDKNLRIQTRDGYYAGAAAAK